MWCVRVSCVSCVSVRVLLPPSLLSLSLSACSSVSLMSRTLLVRPCVYRVRGTCMGTCHCYYLHAPFYLLLVFTLPFPLRHTPYPLSSSSSSSDPHLAHSTHFTSLHFFCLHSTPYGVLSPLMLLHASLSFFFLWLFFFACFFSLLPLAVSCFPLPCSPPRLASPFSPVRSNPHHPTRSGVPVLLPRTATYSPSGDVQKRETADKQDEGQNRARIP